MLFSLFYLQLDGKPGILDLDPLHLDPPRLGGLVQELLHRAGDTLPVTEDLMEILGAEHAGQGRLGEQRGRVVGVLHVGLGHGGVGDAIVDDSIHRDGDRVLGQDLGEVGGSWRQLEVVKGSRRQLKVIRGSRSREEEIKGENISMWEAVEGSRRD